MSTAAPVAGVDAGGTRSTAVVMDRSGAVLGRGTGPAGAVRPGAAEAAAEGILHALASARQAARATTIDRCVVGAAGAGDAALRAELAAALMARGAPADTSVRTDAEVALADALPDGPGILVLSGTGSIALARDPAGHRHRVGGWGWRVGDEGSGHALGRAAVMAVLQALDGRGPPTALIHAVGAELDLHQAAGLAGWVGRADPRAIADLGRLVQEAAAAGDAVALGLLDAAADDLVAHVVALRPHFAGAAAIRVALAGGALAPGRPLRRRVQSVLAARAPWATVTSMEVDAAVGAARLALTGA